MDDEGDLTAAWEYLAGVLAAIDAGEVTASDVQAAYLQGAADVVAQLRDEGVVRPERLAPARRESTS